MTFFESPLFLIIDFGEGEPVVDAGENERFCVLLCVILSGDGEIDIDFSAVSPPPSLLLSFCAAV